MKKKKKIPEQGMRDVSNWEELLIEDRKGREGRTNIRRVDASR